MSLTATLIKRPDGSVPRCQAWSVEDRAPWASRKRHCWRPAGHTGKHRSGASKSAAAYYWEDK